MIRSRSIAWRAAWCALAAALLLPSAAFCGASLALRPGEEPPGPPPDLHIGVTVADAWPQRWPEVDGGYSFSIRLEAEVSERFSPFSEISFGDVTGRATHIGYPFDPTISYTYTTLENHAVTSFGIGGRLHLVRRAVVRPTLEGGMALRYVGSVPTYAYDNLVGRETLEEGIGGPAGFVRLGLTTARPHGAGVFADVGWEFVLRNPGRFGIASARLGILFP